MSRRGGAVTPAESWQENASFGTPPTNTPSYVARSEPTRASRLTARNLEGDFAVEQNGASGSKKSQSITSSKRNVPKKKVAWEEDSSDESPDEWEFAERGPLAKLRAKNQGETAKERAALGFYVDEAEYGDEYDFSDVAMWKKAIGNDPDFIGPESYPRRMRDSHGTSIFICSLTVCPYELCVLQVDAGGKETFACGGCARRTVRCETCTSDVANNTPGAKENYGLAKGGDRRCARCLGIVYDWRAPPAVNASLHR